MAYRILSGATVITKMLAIKYLSICAVLTGAVLLSLSLSNALKIRRDAQGNLRRKWRIMLILMAFFLVAYLFFALALICNLRFPVELVTGAVFLGGAVFANMITGICRGTLADRQEADLSYRRSTEEELHRSRQMLRLVMDNIPQEVFWKDTDLRYLGCNRAFADFAGLEDQELIIGRNDYQMGWRDAARCEEIDRMVIERNAPMLDFEEPFVLHGKELWLRMSRIPLNDRDGKVVGVLGTFEDITERRRSEESLWFTQHSVDESPFPIFRLNRSGEFSYANEACRYLGYSAEELGGLTIFDITPELMRENWGERLADIQAKGTDVFERLHETKDGRLIPVELTVHQLTYNGTDFHVTYVRDIKAQKNAEGKVRCQLERLKSLRSIDLAISGSIDMRVSLNVVLDQVITQLHADAADILLLNYAYKLEYAAGRGFKTDALKHTSLSLGKGNAGRVALERRTIHIADVTAPCNSFVSAPLLHDEGFVGYYGSPLVAKGQVVGVLELYFRSDCRLEQEQLDFLEILAGQAAIAIDNANLFSGLQKSNVELIQAYDSTLEGWSHAMDLRDRETEGHCQRVTKLTERMARAMEISDDYLVHIRRGAMLHDIGKIGIADSILLKSGPLDAAERLAIEKHPVYAYELLSPISYLRPALDIPYCHHEKWDGSGYPRGLKGRQIPLEARIFAIVDVWDALLSDRPYRPAWSRERTLEHIRELSGSHFDPQLVEIFISVMAGDSL